MTLEEAIKHAEEVADKKEREKQKWEKLLEIDCNYRAIITEKVSCELCAEEHKQLAEWLKDYKRLLEQQPCEDAISRQSALLNSLIDNTHLDGYDLAEALDAIENKEKLPPVTQIPIECDDAISREDAEQMFRNIRCHLKPQDYKSAEEFNTRDLMLLNAEQMIHALPSVTQKSGKWIPVSERLPELNRPLLVTTYHRVYYGHLISESGNYGYPVFRIHGLGDKNRDWVQETMSHEPYSLGRIDAWMYLDIPEPYKVESEDCRDCKKFDDCPCGKDGHESGTSQGYSIGECKNFEPQESEDKE